MFLVPPSHVLRIFTACAALAFASAYVAAQETEMTPPDSAPAPAAEAPAAPATAAASLAQPAASAAGTTVAIVVDTSRNGARRRDLLKSTAARFVRDLPESTDACLFGAGDRPVLLQGCSGDHRLVTRAVERLRTGGRSALQATIKQAADHLRSNSASERLAIVLFTTARKVEEPNLEDSIVSLRGQRTVELNAIAGPEADWQLQQQLQSLAVKTGGFAYFAPKASELTKVATAAAHKLGSDDALATNANAERGDIAYSAVIVRDVAVADNPDTREFQSGDDQLLQKLLIGRLQHDNIFPYVIDGRNQSHVQAQQSRGRTLELVTSIVQYRRGNRTQRRLMGYIGGAMVKVNVLLRDALTGRPVQAFMAKGASSSGLFGGSDEAVQQKALKEVVANIAEDVKKYSRGK